MSAAEGIEPIAIRLRAKRLGADLSSNAFNFTLPIYFKHFS